MDSENVVPDLKTQPCLSLLCCFSPRATSFTAPWLCPRLCFTSQALITAPLSCCNSLFSAPPHDLSDPLLTTIQPSATKLFLTYYSFHLSIDNSLLIILKSKLLCLTCKVFIISPHPIYSIFYPTMCNTHPLNQLGCYLNRRGRNPHTSTTTIFLPPMTSSCLGHKLAKMSPSFEGPAQISNI